MFIAQKGFLASRIKTRKGFALAFAKQQQDVGQLSRDTENANHVLEQIFDKDKELETIEVINTIKEISQQVNTVMENADKLAAQKAAQKAKDSAAAELSQEEIQAAKEAL